MTRIGTRLKAAVAALCVSAAICASPATANPSLVFDLATGEVLAHDDAFQRWYPASLSKLMTAYVTFRAIRAGELTLESPIRVTSKAAAEVPSKMGFPAGSILTLDNALKMMLVKSANDIAMAVAENVGGSQEDFAIRMNLESARLGMTGSRWVNPHGLFHVEQYSTARDFAVLVAAIRTEFPEYSPYFSIEAIGIGKKVMPAYNQLIGRFDGADGMKTGFVCPSGFNLIATATRDGRTLAAIVFGAPNAKARTVEAADKLTTGFATSGQGKPLLRSLQVYGEANDVPMNLREEICEKKPDAAKGGEAGAGEKLESPFVHELTRPRRVVMVGLGGATGPVPLNQPFDAPVGAVPKPTPRPDPATLEAAAKAKASSAKAASAKPAKAKSSTAKPAKAKKPVARKAPVSAAATTATSVN